MNYSVILFDVDGTLCDPGKSMIECARFALEQQGIHETDDEQLRRLIGPPLEHAFRDYYGFNPKQTEVAVKHFRTKMQTDGIQLYEPYPGIVEVLDSLQNSEKTLAIVTSKIEHIALETLEKTQLRPYFKVICAQEPDVVVEKQEILARALDLLRISDTSQVVMIGDRKHDVEAANAHGIDSIGVLWGYGSLEELEQEGATYTVSNTSELLRLLS